MGIDLLFITRALTKDARVEIEKRCGIKAGNILLGASHSHSSGPIGMAEPGDFDQAPPAVQDLYFNKSVGRHCCGGQARTLFAVLPTTWKNTSPSIRNAAIHTLLRLTCAISSNFA